MYMWNFFRFNIYFDWINTKTKNIMIIGFDLKFFHDLEH